MVVVQMGKGAATQAVACAVAINGVSIDEVAVAVLALVLERKPEHPPEPVEDQKVVFVEREGWKGNGGIRGVIVNRHRVGMCGNNRGRD